MFSDRREQRRARRAARRSGRAPELLGLVLVVVGIFYLLDNTGLLRVSWSVIWAVGIIAIGVVILAGTIGPARDHPSNAVIGREGSGRLELDLTAGAGRFRLEGGSAELVEVASGNDDVVTRVDRSGDLARVRLRQDVAWWPGSWNGGSDWTVRVAPDVPTLLTLNAGAGDFFFDLSRMVVAEARIQVGAARAEVVLPNPRGAINVRISAGAADVRVTAPAGVEYRLETNGLLTVNGRTESPGYANATNRVLVRFSGGAASVRIG